MAGYTEIFQGRFTSAGVRTQIDFVSDIDWMEVINGTVAAAGGADTGVKFLWQRGFADDSGFIYTKLAADDSITLGVMANGGFTRRETVGNPDGAINATLTGITNAAPPIVTCTNTAGLVAGDTVRFVNVPGAQQFGGIEFTIDTIVANTSFRLVFGPQIVATGAVVGSFYPVRWAPNYYPRRRTITSITQAANAVIVTTVFHGLTVGQRIRLKVPAEFGMVEADEVEGTITAINAATNTMTTDINTAAMTAFAWPLTAAVPFTHAEVIPIGETSGTAGAITLDDATTNTATRAMLLAAGVNSPAGALNDIIYWRAGRSFSVNNV